MKIAPRQSYQVAMVVLCGVNASYQYPSLGLRYLLANMGELQPQTRLLEFTVKQDPLDIVEKILALGPTVVGIGAYIWNIDHVLRVASHLKQLAPHIHLVLGGPEVSHELAGQKILQYADVVIQGEADLAFADHCQEFLAGSYRADNPEPKVIQATLPDIDAIRTPYSLYSEAELQTRHICVEASRGCPFKCHYCLSALDKSVRSFPIDPFLSELKALLGRGARNFKFIDRTFNLSPATCDQILKFFLPWKDQGLFLHFEMVPDRLPIAIRDLVQEFPPGSIQFEIGLQTLNPEVAERVQRSNRWQKVVENFQFLTEETNVHIHADLIAGLPGEDIDSFALGFDELLLLKPHEIQLGILKRLKGTPIVQHTDEWGMIYSTSAPYQVLKTNHMSYFELQGIQRFAKYWDRIHNSGDFSHTLPLLWDCANQRNDGSSFWQFMELVEYLFEEFPTSHGLSYLNLVRSVRNFLVGKKGMDAEQVSLSLAKDYSRDGLREVPNFLRNSSATPLGKGPKLNNSPSRRQQKHLLN